MSPDNNTPEKEEEKALIMVDVDRVVFYTIFAAFIMLCFMYFDVVSNTHKEDPIYTPIQETSHSDVLPSEQSNK